MMGAAPTSDAGQHLGQGGKSNPHDEKSLASYLVLGDSPEVHHPLGCLSTAHQGNVVQQAKRSASFSYQHTYRQHEAPASRPRF